jgi:hypothetical protein
MRPSSDPHIVAKMARLHRSTTAPIRCRPVPWAPPLLPHERSPSPLMPRLRRRMILDGGFCFDVNVMVRAGLRTGTCKFLANTQEVAADLRMDAGARSGRLRLQHPDFDQTIGLTAEARHFGGRQWYWICPMTDNRCSVLYRRTGARCSPVRSTGGSVEWPTGHNSLHPTIVRV